MIDADEETNAILEKLAKIRQQEAVVSLSGQLQPRLLIGGKAFGLQEAINNFPISINIPDGAIVTSEAVDDLFLQDEDMHKLIMDLELGESLEHRLQIAEQIRNKIMETQFSNDLLGLLQSHLAELNAESFAVRSSSWDEDNANGETAAGIYKSCLNVAPADISQAVKECVSSFFSDKAVNFRSLKGFSDIPHFAVLIQPMLKGTGGVAFSIICTRTLTTGFSLKLAKMRMQ